MSKRQTGRKAPSLSILPMQLQVGDTFTDEEGEGEVVSRPWITHGGKTVYATVARSGDPGTKRDKNWARTTGSWWGVQQGALACRNPVTVRAVTS